MGIEQVIRVFYARQPDFRLRHILALFCDLSQRQVGLRQTPVRRACLRASRACGYQRHVALEAVFGQLMLVVVQRQGAAHQPGLGEFRSLGGHQVELAGRLRVTPPINQGAGVVHADFKLRLAIKVFFHQNFSRRLLGGHQCQREQGGSIGFGVERLPFARGVQRSAAIAGVHAQAADGGPGGHADGGGAQVLGQCLLHRLGCRLFVAGTGKVARNCGDRERPVFGISAGNFALERLHRLGQSVHADQDLQRVAVGLTRVGQGLPPSACGL